MQTIGAGREGDGRPVGRRKIVLPRFLRRPVRVLARMRLAVPPHTGSKLSLAFLLATGAAGVVMGGHTETVGETFTKWSGLVVERVEITGQSETSEVEVLRELALGDSPSIIAFDLAAARERIRTLPWVKEVTLRKVYPNCVQIEIAERKPYAVWQLDNGFVLIEEDGYAISNQVDASHASLPRVVGPGAGERAAEFVALIAEFPSLKPRVKAGVLVSGRRWNVVLDNGVELLLPQEDPAGALIQAVALDDGHGVFSREIAAIDMRLPNRLVFRLTAEGVKAREELLEAREKARKKGTAA